MHVRPGTCSQVWDPPRAEVRPADPPRPRWWRSCHRAEPKTRSVSRLPLGSNRALLAATVVILSLQALVIYLPPPLQFVFGTSALSAHELAVPLLAGAFVLAAMELAKRV